MRPQADAPFIAELQHAARDVLASVLGNGSTAHGIEIAPEETWGDRASRVVPTGGVEDVRLAHDAQGAPFAIGRDDLLVSFSDECGIAALAWTIPAANSGILGIGIDLVDAGYFHGDLGRTRAGLLLSERDFSVLEERHANAAEREFAFAFSAKEAAFKACAAPLRSWRTRNGEELELGVRQFELDGTDCARFRPGRDRADNVLETLGIRRIRLGHAVVDRMAVTIAASLMS